MAARTDVMHLEAPAPSADPPMAPSAAAGIALARLGEYRLVREVGRGAMGVVYEAVQESLDRRVALKVLPPGLAARGAFRERFRREAQVAGRLHHTSIVPVHGSGEQDGFYFYAMQFIQGQSLDAVLEDVRRLRGLGAAADADATSVRGALSEAARGLVDDCFPDGPLTTPPADSRAPVPHGREELVGPPGAAYYRGAARLALQAAEALAYAHGQGVLHRDVKPSNLLIDGHGTLWVSDFGLAKVDEAADLTAVNDLVGTLRYMAPERFRGRSDGRSDVYSLGATLYEMLTLRPAFAETDRVQLIAQVTQHAPPAPRQIAPDAPRDLETIVIKAMARDPADRYATAAAMAEDLRRFLEDRLILARRASVLERLRRWRRRSPTAAALTASVTALLLLLAVGSTVAAFWLKGAWDEAVKANDNAVKAKDEAVRVNGTLERTNGLLTSANARVSADYGALQNANDDIKDKLWHSYYQRARASRFSSRPGRRFDSLEALRDALSLRPDYRDGMGQLRTEAIACLALADLRPCRAEHPCPAGVFDLDFDDNLERYAFTDRQGNVAVRRASDDHPIADLSTGFETAASWVELSRDGRFVAVRPDGPGGRLLVWDLDSAGPGIKPRIDEQNRVACAAFSPDSSRVVVGYTDGRIVSFDPTTGQALRQMQGERGCLAVAVHPSGQRLAVSDEKSITFYDLETGDRLAGWPTPSPMESLAWRSQDGRFLASVGKDRRVYSWDAITRQQKAVMEGTLAGGIRIAFSHGGDVLAGRDASGLLRLWDPRTGRQLFGMAADLRALRFGRDDHFLACAVLGDQMRTLEIALSQEYQTLAAEPEPHGPAEFSGSAAIHPNGRLLAAAMSDGVRLWDLDGGEQCTFLPVGRTVAVAFDAAGALLASKDGRDKDIVRWPILSDAERLPEVRVGPLEKMPLHGVGAGLACSRQGQATAAATREGAEVLDEERSPEPIRLRVHEDNGDEVRDLAISPDGRWVAACSHSGKGVNIWDVARRVVAKPLAVAGVSGAVFSPDGCRLAVGGVDDCQVLAVGSWEPVGEKIAGRALAFSADGDFLAVESGRGVVTLVHPETGAELARLEDPNQDRGEVVFTPDGGRMVVVSQDGRCIHVWDLHRLRRQLWDRGLDW